MMPAFCALTSIPRSLTTNTKTAYKLPSMAATNLLRLSSQRTVGPHFTPASALCRNCSLLAPLGVRFQHVPVRVFVRLGKPRAQESTVASLLGRRGKSLWTESVGVRMMSTGGLKSDSYHRRTGLIYVCAAGIFMLGMSYAGVPLYRMFCQATGLGGTISRGHDTSKVETMQSVPERLLNIRFNADVASSMRWNFKPQQVEVKVLPGETALAFYTAKNPTDKPIIGISTYNVVPFEAGQYFNKIQCFCFEEQRLNPHEQVDMPVFFYIDPEFADDPKLQGVNTITLSYTFFEAKEGFQVPMPEFMTQTQ
ncbi:Cytochrome c oxidase assembly protein cox11, mitochondrial [Nucella lapillus]